MVPSPPLLVTVRVWGKGSNSAVQLLATVRVTWAEFGEFGLAGAVAVPLDEFRTGIGGGGEGDEGVRVKGGGAVFSTVDTGWNAGEDAVTVAAFEDAEFEWIALKVGGTSHRGVDGGNDSWRGALRAIASPANEAGVGYGLGD